METKHTPGPWVVDPDSPNDISPADDLRLGIALISNADNIDGAWLFGDESKANAKLIAAAPELLESLINLVGLARLGAAQLGKYHAALAHAEAVIAKAIA